MTACCSSEVAYLTGMSLDELLQDSVSYIMDTESTEVGSDLKTD